MAAVGGLLAFAAAADAALVYVKGRAEPLAGYVDQSDPETVAVREILPGGKTRQHRVPRGDVEDIVVTVSAARLEALAPARPQDYRDYAEELAEKRRDPEAREVSLRLYLIAAHLDPQQLGRSCLLGMAQLAVGRDESRRYRAMAYLLDPLHDRGALAEEPPAAPQATDPATGDERLLRALQFLRQGDQRRARTLAQHPEVLEAFVRWERYVSLDEFTSALTGDLSPAFLQRLLQLELELQREASPANTAGEGRAEPWSAIVGRSGTEPMPPLSLETITPWDPRACLYRNGSWTRP